VIIKVSPQDLYLSFGVKGFEIEEEIGFRFYHKEFKATSVGGWVQG
jgi:hypothetical protein